MDKSPDAFRTISEVAEVLETPAHVLRFWESRFPQIRPVKRAGGRRYYRPADVALLTGIKRLLHDEGLTIRGVQKILREQGVRHVAALSGQLIPDEGEDAEAALEAALAANFPETRGPVPAAEAESAQVVALETALRRDGPAAADTPPAEVVALFDTAAEPPAAAPSDEPVPEAAHWADPELDLWSVPAPAEPAAGLPRAAMTAEAGESSDTRAAPALPADAPLAARLAALPAAALAGEPAAAALLDRLRALHLRLSSPPPPVTY